MKYNPKTSSLSSLVPIPPELDRHINNLQLDSRLITVGDVFIACPASNQDANYHGKNYIDKAIQAGAVAILIDATEQQAIEFHHNIPCIPYPELNQQLGHIAAQFYANPSQQLNCIAVTGTNGKTSVSHFIAQLLSQQLPKPCGLLGTLGYGVYGQLQTGQHTTPDALRLQALLANLVSKDTSHLVMEVSSHALAQNRVQGMEFNTAIFTNLTRDHLDYHGTMENYAKAKQQLFNWPNLSNAIINLDDEFGKILLAKLANKVQNLTYSLTNPQADLFATATACKQGYKLQIKTPWGTGQVLSPLLAKFNIANLLAALGACLLENMNLEQILTGIESLKPVTGRMEAIHRPATPLIVIDYAHTPDALAQALQALRPHCQGELYCVFGCGGDRDKGKRPLMGKIAAQYADKLLITNDNPRHEKPNNIIADIVKGIDSAVNTIPDRATAIAKAMHLATPKDVVLIAGKGHETYQQIGDNFINFSDREQVLANLSSVQATS
jgi:UDP-N-acetylmuramoyl-L-alanyl-D-glutamate--2,6-diaminopimelate ligase